jgi:dihydrofolate reductase/thymidylate synthase
MKFSIIVATDTDGGIGRNDANVFSIPWNSSVDMKFFKETTSNTININKKNAIIMGRNTYFSLPKRNNTRCLINRYNIVISSQPELFEKDSSIICYDSLDLALKHCSDIKDIENIFVIGGAKLYDEALHHNNLEYIYWNMILETDDECNIFFPTKMINIFKFCSLDTNYCLVNANSSKIQFNKFNVNIKNNDELNYLKLLENILDNGVERQTRNSVTKSLFGEKLEFDLKDKFPLLTTKRMFLRGIFEELIWFFKGQTDSKLLEEKNVNIWKQNSSQEFIDSVGLPYKEGDIGNMYGFQLLHAGAEYEGCNENYTGKGFNQIEYCLNLLKTDKYSRRILMTTFIPHEASKGVLYPCHGLTIQWYVREYDGINYLSCHMYQRSADMFLGIPFNISSYALICYMFCHVLNNDSSYDGIPFKPDKLIMSFGDIHIYENHYEQVHKQIGRKPYVFPQIKFKRNLDKLQDFVWEDIEIINYNHYAGIKAEMVA